jgi:membrane protein DedA with SNARE-associated domain
LWPFHSLNFNKKVQPNEELHFLIQSQINGHFLAALYFAHLALASAAIAALPAALILLFAGFISDLAGDSAFFPALTLAHLAF